MRTAFHATRFALTVGAFSGVLISASGYAADLNEVRITFDKDVAARTNLIDRHILQETHGTARQPARHPLAKL